MDKKDMFSFFLESKNNYDDNQLLLLFENYEISKLDINRIYRYIDKYTKENAADEVEVQVAAGSGRVDTQNRHRAGEAAAIPGAQIVVFGE